MITPTNGRIVWYHSGKIEPGVFNHHGDDPLAAIVTHVWSDTRVNLTVFDSNGIPHGRSSVQLIQDGDEAPAGAAYCEWMPYQKGQAAKAEALEAQLKQGDKA